ncbi:DUF1877 family protein [Micromonospora sp. WP24]|uniref:DUF1877 family protein n=1 Tax=Micromonospora sp. WP24 TaxID=2604469 RepID=UPI0011D41112|nr:DUF1877 family protein [Micromonospora sp. WP24]
MTAADIYPNVWGRGAGDFDSEFPRAFADLCRFYRLAAALGQAVLLAISSLPWDATDRRVSRNRGRADHRSVSG